MMHPFPFSVSAACIQSELTLSTKISTTSKLRAELSMRQTLTLTDQDRVQPLCCAMEMVALPPYSMAIPPDLERKPVPVFMYRPDEPLDNRATPFRFWGDQVGRLVSISSDFCGYQRIFNQLHNRNNSIYPSALSGTPLLNPPEELFALLAKGRHRIFTEHVAHPYLRCERCRTPHDHNMQPVRYPIYLDDENSFTMSYVFCSNPGGDCFVKPCKWWQSRERLLMDFHSKMRLHELAIIGKLDGRELLQLLHPNGIFVRIYLQDLADAGKAFRMVWIHHFACHRGDWSNHTSNMSATGQTHRPIKEIQPMPAFTEPARITRAVTKPIADQIRRLHGPTVWFWGDVQMDYDLFDNGLIAEAEFTYMYGIPPHTARRLMHAHWWREIALLNAWVGMRRQVAQELFPRMKRALQRIGSALQNVTGPMTSRRQESSMTEQENIVLLRFAGFHSALFFDMEAFGNGRFVTERPPTKSHNRRKTPSPTFAQHISRPH